MSGGGPDVLTSMLPLLGLYSLAGWQTMVLLALGGGLAGLAQEIVG